MNVRENPDALEKGKKKRREEKARGRRNEMKEEDKVALRGHRVHERKRKRKRWTNLNTTAWYRMARERPVEGDRGVDLDSDGPEPLAIVGQLSSPRFVSFFEPPLCTHEKEILLC